MEGCLTSLRREISRIAVDGTPSDSLMYRKVNFKFKIKTEMNYKDNMYLILTSLDEFSLGRQFFQFQYQQP